MGRIRIKSIKNRMICVCLLLSIVPICILGSVSYRTSANAIMQQVVKIHEYNIDTYDRSITTAFHTLRRATQVFIYGEQFSTGGEIVSLLEKDADYYDGLSIYKQFELKRDLNERIDRLIPYNFEVSQIILDNREGFRYTFSIRDDKTYSGLETDHIEREYEEMFAKASLLENREVFARVDENTFSYMRLIYSLKDFKAKGFLMLEVDSSILESVLPVGDELENEAYVVVDTFDPEHQDIVFATGNLENIEGLMDAYYAQTLDTGKNWTVGRVHNEASGWDVFYIADTRALAEKAKTINMLTIFLSAVMCVAVAVLGIWLTRVINSPLTKLGNAIRRVDEEGDYRITESFGEDEIGRIGQQFVRMVEQNLALKDRLYQTEIKQKEAELIALQAQINPHFLYNTLDAIYLMTQMGRAEEAGEMTLALSEIFRTGLNKGQEFIKVSEEEKYIHNYLYIQKMRYGDRLQYEIAIEESILEEQMLKLVLQPIIENAIYHGLEPKVSGGRLQITGKRVGQEMVFCVTDDGVGMEGDAWKRGYGLTNVRERLKLYYGGAYDIAVRSQVGKGTVMEVRIPITLNVGEWV